MLPSKLRVIASMRNCNMMSVVCPTHRDADSDLARPFGNAHEHNVHDTDPPDEQ
jgi:hypothetical protein